ncbi:MAG TPA: nucleoside-diphosphate sugar epimerase/dehydratase [Clostridia bacterium]|nr:nucleoside-diphosphate sugar epimerase/dehydratase [Clostridia bacterium]
MIAYDLVASLAALILAIYINYNGIMPVRMMNYLKMTWFIVVGLAGICFALFGFYSQMWAFARGSQYLVLMAGTVLHLFLTVLSLQIVKRNFPFSVYIIYWFLLTSAVLAIRVFYRFYQARQQATRMRKRAKDGVPVRVMIVGAGSAASQIIVELKMRQTVRVPILAVDDNPLTHFYKNNGIPVLGDRHDIVQLAQDYKIDEIIVAIPSASSKAIREILTICNSTDCRVRLLPFFSELASDEVSLADIRDLRIEDLLGRDPVRYDMEKVSRFVRGKVVLVTGGGGSIGSELAKQIASFKPSLLILYDIYENGVFDLQQELLERYGPALNLKVLIGSVRDGKRLEEVFTKWRPDVVFHAAAHKHVPLMEDSPGEAVKNNVYGTYNTALISALHGTGRFVLVSTDKAVNPTNVMGATKRLCEIVILTLGRILKDTQFAAVRFGNVLGSSGSVVPLFERQIKERRAVTVTHPDVERFFMTIPEASSLVLQAGAYARGGEIFILDMGDPVRIDDLARDMIRVSGLVPGVDIPIEYVGLRPGEKMREELFLCEETTEQTEHEKIFILSQIDNLDFLRAEIKTLERIIATDDAGLEGFMEQLMSALASAAESECGDLSGMLPYVPYDSSWHMLCPAPDTKAH